MDIFWNYTIQCIAMQCNAMQSKAKQCNAMQYNTLTIQILCQLPMRAFQRQLCSLITTIIIIITNVFILLFASLPDFLLKRMTDSQEGMVLLLYH